MALRPRLTLLAAGTVAVAILLASLVCYLAMRAELRSQVDESLTQQGSLIARAARTLNERTLEDVPRPPQPVGGVVATAQLIGPSGVIRRRDASWPALPVTATDREVLTGRRGRTLTDREVDGTHLRVLTVRVSKNRAALVARSLEDVDATLARLRLVLAGVLILGAAFALVASRVFSRTVIEPVTQLTEAAEQITATEDLGLRIHAQGDDEVGRMAKRFNAMLDRLQASRGALATSVEAQRQLIADASHELRTPITSLRTNLEVLLDGQLGQADRQRLLDEVREQAEELSALINDVIELARGDQPSGEFELVALDAVVAEAVERARRHAPNVQFTLTAEPTIVSGLPDRLGRAVSNLLDNAAKYGARRVDITVAPGEVTVSDNGPGIPAEESEQIFDRFHRGTTSHARPGSGLGLAIVRQVADTHNGRITLDTAPGGGALFRLCLPPPPEASGPTPPDLTRARPIGA
jgi:two-component system, OmpR family, sensor histidine kinase MprB